MNDFVVLSKFVFYKCYGCNNRQQMVRTNEIIRRYNCVFGFTYNQVVGFLYNISTTIIIFIIHCISLMHI